MRKVLQYLNGLLLTLSVSMPLSTNAQLPENFWLIEEEVQKELTSTYGYYIATVGLIQACREAQPAFRSQLIEAEDEFTATFGASIQAIDRSMQGKNSTWGAAKVGIKNSINPEIRRLANNANSEYVAMLVQNVNASCRGVIVSPILETLLIHQPEYQLRPEKEISDGFKRSFFSASDPSTDSVKFRVDLPMSWSSPNKTIADPPKGVAFSSRNGRGVEMIGIFITDYPFADEAKESESALRSQFNQKDMHTMLQEMAIPNARLLSSNNTLKIDGKPAGSLRFSFEGRRFDEVRTIQSRIFMIWLPRLNKIVYLSCIIAPTPFGVESDANAKFPKFESLFKLIADSIKFETH